MHSRSDTAAKQDPAFLLSGTVTTVQVPVRNICIEEDAPAGQLGRAPEEMPDTSRGAATPSAGRFKPAI
jgi:hypothetical protein